MFISLHPGTIQTDLGRHMSSFQQTLGRMVTQPVSYGAITPLYAGTASEAGELNGKVGFSSFQFHSVLELLFSISPFGRERRFPTRRHLIPISARHCGNGVKIKSKTCRVTIPLRHIRHTNYTTFSPHIPVFMQYVDLRSWINKNNAVVLEISMLAFIFKCAKAEF